MENPLEVAVPSVPFEFPTVVVGVMVEVCNVVPIVEDNSGELVALAAAAEELIAESAFHILHIRDYKSKASHLNI